MYPKLIALTGFKGSGKDESALALTGYTRYGIADPVKEICAIAFGLTEEEMTGDRVLKEKGLDRWPYESPRRLMQQVGTDLFRTLWPDVWVQAMRRHILNHEGQFIVISDLRFPNECEAVHQLGGIVVRVVRTDQPESLDPHPSERYIPQLPVDHEILAATGEIESLHRQIRMIAGLPVELTEEDYYE